MTVTGLPLADDADLARVTEALQMITPRWMVRILLALNRPPQRYTALATRFPYLQSGQLHPRLRQLCAAGLVERAEHSPRHVMYGLTDRGRELLPVFQLIAQWADEYLEPTEQRPAVIEQIEDSLTLLSRRQVPAILWALKLRGEITARALAHLVIPGEANWTVIYPPLRQMTDDGLVISTGKGRPYVLTPAGHGLGPVLGAVSMWAAGRPVSQGAGHRLWGRPESAWREAGAGTHSWGGYQSRLPAPPARPGPPVPTAPPLPTAPAARPARHMAWRHHELFSHSHTDHLFDSADTARLATNPAALIAGAGR